MFADGHDAVSRELLFKHVDENDWKRVPMEFRHNDHWVASFRVEKLGRYQYTVRGWTDPFLTWKRDLKKRQEAGQDLTIDLQIGSQLLGSDIADFEAGMAADLPAPAETEPRILERSWRSSSTRCARASAPGTSCSRAPSAASRA